MKLLLSNIIIYSFLMTQSTSCQTIPIKTNPPDCYSYIAGNQKINVCEIEMLNQSQEDYVIWFDKQSVENFDEKRKIHAYFFKIKGDFNLFNLLVEKDLKNEPTIIFETFLKKIGKGETFRLKIIGNEVTPDKSQLFIAEHMVAIKFSVLQEQLKQPDNFFPWYELENIDLLERDLE